MNIKTLAHVCIRTVDLDRTTEFYCSALGMKKQFQFTRQGKVIGCYISASSNTFIEVFLVDEIVPVAANQNLHHFCLETDDIRMLRAELIRCGYSPGEIKLGADNSHQFWIVDPNGLNIEFHEYTDRSAQITGEDVEVNW